MSRIHASIACNLDTNMLLASLPLFESEKVQAIEWSFDAVYKFNDIPDWFFELLRAFDAERRLIGHGVFFSLFSGQWRPEQQRWLDNLSALSQEFHFDHITEHFGFMTGADFHAGAPIGLPFTPATLAIGRDRLARVYEACQCPVGLENLAFSYSLEEVKKHGEFLDQLVAPLNGFIILDLHNLYCQIHNFDIDFEEIIRLYPLHRVREIHISGGSWEDSPLRPANAVRRDTHDEAVPEEVFQLLERSLPLCPQLRYVVLEQLGTGLASPESRLAFQQDFYRLEALLRHVDGGATPLPFLPAATPALGAPLEDAVLHAQQLELSRILETAADYPAARQWLQSSSLANTAWNTEHWAPYMLDTAMRIAQKWKTGF